MLNGYIDTERLVNAENLAIESQLNLSTEQLREQLRLKYIIMYNFLK
jgi:hypothetical protein